MMNNPADNVYLHVGTSHGLAEHEAKLSFNDDDHVELFTDWWDNHGLNKFREWFETNKEYLKENQ